MFIIYFSILQKSLISILSILFSFHYTIVLPKARSGLSWARAGSTVICMAMEEAFGPGVKLNKNFSLPPCLPNFNTNTNTKNQHSSRLLNISLNDIWPQIYWYIYMFICLFVFFSWTQYSRWMWKTLTLTLLLQLAFYI